MYLNLDRPGSRLINVEHPKVFTLESDFKKYLSLASYSSRERKDCVTSPKRNVKAEQENIIAQSQVDISRIRVFCDYNLVLVSMLC